jgi:cytoskeletal protein RodZ
VVEDLESDRYDRLPVEYYCIRHIEALCREYGIAADPIVEQFKREFSTQDGGAPHAERFSVTSLESESGSKVTYTPTSATVAGAGKRSISITGIIVSVLILLLAVLAVGAWAVQQWRSRAPAGEDELSTPQEARDLTQFIVPQQLPLDSMPIPKD